MTTLNLILTARAIIGFHSTLVQEPNAEGISGNQIFLPE
jgi:hypothetical protein